MATAQHQLSLQGSPLLSTIDRKVIRLCHVTYKQRFKACSGNTGGRQPGLGCQLTMCNMGLDPIGTP